MANFDSTHPFVFTVPGASVDAGNQTGPGPHTWIAGPDAVVGVAVPISSDGTRAAVMFVTLLSTQVPHDSYGDSTDFRFTCSSGIGHQAWGLHPTLLFFDPADLLAVANGTASESSPRPYLQVDLITHFFDRNRSQCARLGGATYDLQTRRLFIVEMYVDSAAKPVVHVLQL